MAQLVNVSRASMRLLRGAAASPFRPAAPARFLSVKANAELDRKLQVAHIMVATDKASLLDEYEKQLQAGASFAELAKAHSECKSAQRGGELGWLERGTYFPEFEAAAFAAKKGERVRCVTPRGAHLVAILDEKFHAKVQNMSVEQLYEVLHNPGLSEDVQFVDVREQREWDLARVPAFKLMPLSEFQQWSEKISTLLDPKKETVCLCHHGMRSMQMAQFLVSQGFTNVKNVTGGIDAYSRMDGSIPIY